MDVREKINKIVEILDVIYELQCDKLQIKRKNLCSINLDTLIEHIELGKVRGEFSQDKDLIRYVEAIIED